MLLHTSPRKYAAKNSAVQAEVRDFLPPTLIAGSLPVAKKASAAQVAYNAASLALDTERVCLITSFADGKVNYLAGAASDFASQGAVSTLLASALPNAPQHKGYGAYYCPLVDNSGMACVITTASGIKCFVGSEADAERFPVAEQVTDCPTYRLKNFSDELNAMPRWQSFSEYDRSDNRTLLRRLLMVGGLNAVVMGVMWLGATIYVARTTAQINDFAMQARTVLSAASETYVQKGGGRHPAWQEFQNVSSFVLTHRGHLLKFDLKDGKVSWSMDVPDFITGDEIGRIFGSGIQTRKEGNMIRISKGRGAQ
jgi:hypothetical protein